jgi:ComF family protein
MNKTSQFFLQKVSLGLCRLKSIIFPPTCAFCAAPIEEYHSLCAQCWLHLKFINRNVCGVCGESITSQPSEKYERATSFQQCASCASLKTHHISPLVRAVIVYDDFSKQFILRFKEKNDPSLALFFSKLFHPQDFDNLDFLIPVPIHPLRLWQRTYNQAALLALGLQHWNADRFEICFDGLKRSRYTSKQKRRKFEERQQNVQNSMFVPYSSRAVLLGKRVAVIDDVVASGATLAECKRALEEAGVKEVRCFALAQVV